MAVREAAPNRGVYRLRGVSATMEGRWTESGIVVGAPARRRLLASGGVGRPHGAEGVELTWVEAVFLLERGDLAAVDGDGFVDLLERPPDAHALDRWLVYRDLRARGYYVATAHGPGDPPQPGRPAFDVRPRGASPTSEEVAHRVAVVPETTPLSLGALSSLTLAVADDEGEITYLGVDTFVPDGESRVPEWEAPRGTAAGRRVVVPDPPAAMFDPGFFGRRLDDDTLVLNELEARYLAEADRLALADGPAGVAPDPRRYATYAALRDGGCVPRSGLKFGADFRVYTAVADATDPGHSAFLVEVVAGDATASARTLSRAVRLAGGVRKAHVLALVDGDGVRWLVLERRRL